MSMSTPVTRATKDQNPFASAGPLQLQALGMIPTPTANAKELQTQALKKLRKQQISDYKREYQKTVGLTIGSNDAAQMYADALNTLDEAFWRGYRKQTVKLSANAQQLDWEEWEHRDDTPVTEARVATSMTEDLLGAGLGIDTSLARMISRWPIRSEAFEVDRNMDARNRGTSDAPETAYEAVSLPISFIDYELSWREIQNSQSMGESIDAQSAVEAGETLAVAQEELMADGWDVAIPVEGLGTITVDGYRTTNYRITDAAPGPWSDASNGASNVLATFEAMMQGLHGQTDDQNRGADVQDDGAFVYYPRAQWSNVTLKADPKGDGNLSIAERIEQDYPWLTLRQSGVLDPDEVIMVVNNRRFVDLADAQAETNMSWDVEGGMATRFKAMNCRIPRIKGTFGPDAESVDDAIVGVAHYTGI